MKRLKIRKIGTLAVIASLFIFSASLRIIGVSSIAIASGDGGAAPAREPTEMRETKDLDALLLSFKEREAKLDAYDEELAQRSSKLRDAEASIGKKMNELIEAETRLRELLAIADSASEDDVARLTTVYENMKPADAAALFEEMAPEFASGFLVRMRPEAAAAVMTGLEPQTAYSISVIIAGRNANAPIE